MKEIRSKWIVLESGCLTVTDMIYLAKTDSVYHCLCGILLQRVREQQKHALLRNRSLNQMELSQYIWPLGPNIVYRKRWNFLKTGSLTLGDTKISTMVDKLELMWRLKHCQLDPTQKRTVWGWLWQNTRTSRIRLLYSVAKEFDIPTYIPVKLEESYGIQQAQLDVWIQWVQSGSLDVDSVPSIPCPVWGETLLNTPRQRMTIQTFPSATRPLLMRWGVDRRGILWKRESGYVDRMIEYSIAFISESLYEFGMLQSKQTWYDVVSLTRDVVAIQIVPNCIALSELVGTKKSILEFVCDHNDDVSVASVRRRLMESIAFSSAVSWFFGFGDRHLDNIMVSKSGSLFHIDFGYCFGREPKLGVPRIRITEDMMKSLGVDYWKQCLQKGQSIMDWLRAHLPTLRMISDFMSGDSKSYIDAHWNTIEQDTTTFEELAMESIQSWTTSLHDFFHSSAQSFRSFTSIWNSITR